MFDGRYMKTVGLMLPYNLVDDNDSNYRQALLDTTSAVSIPAVTNALKLHIQC